ncbi:MAG: helix-turn-helix transcriptional regulator [Vulcanimicrobiota bacterium]
MNRIERILAIDEALRGPVAPSTSRLADQLGVSYRTVMRDISWLRKNLKAPLVYEADSGGYRYSDRGYRLSLPGETDMPKPIENAARLERILMIHPVIRDHTYPSREDLAARCEVSVRTISRDLDFLRDRLGAPLENDPRRGYYYSDETWFLPEIMMTEGELLATYLSGTVMRDALSASFAVHLESAISKLAASLPDAVKVSLAELASHLDFPGGPDRRLDAAHFQAIQAALKKRPLWIRYYAAHRDEMSERIVEPLHLRYHLGDWYLVAYCRLRRDFRTFAVSRVHALRKERGSVAAHPNFSAEEYFQNALGILSQQKAVTVKIWFSAERARWVAEKRWHSTQRLEPGPDGSLVLEMKVGSTAELLQWVLSYGSHARVLTPASLAEEVRQEARKMLKS